MKRKKNGKWASCRRRQFCQACERGESGYKLANDHTAVKRAINASFPSSLISRS